MTGKDETTGRFTQGNRFWEARSGPCRKPKFAEPEQLWSAAVEYFEWVTDNPIFEDTIVTFQGVATHEPLAKMRAMTNRGLQLFLGISHETWRGWKTDGHDLHRPDLADVIERIEAVIYEQKFTGAAAGLLNHGIIARELGLADKQEIDSKHDVSDALSELLGVVSDKSRRIGS